LVAAVEADGADQVQGGRSPKIVIGHGHWDHAGNLDEFPNAILYVQKEELRGIEWALNYPNPKISAVNTSRAAVPGRRPWLSAENRRPDLPRCCGVRP
jgi:glyoxylase-like metal-dependent hydrolase (beta-lactamase superfamily II)